MSIYIKNNGTWSVSNIRAKKSEVWQNVGTGYIKVNGTWQQFYSTSIPIENGTLTYNDSYRDSAIVELTVTPTTNPDQFNYYWRVYDILTDYYGSWNWFLNQSIDYVDDGSGSQTLTFYSQTPQYAGALQFRALPLYNGAEGTEILSTIFYGYCSQCGGGQIGIR